MDKTELLTIVEGAMPDGVTFSVEDGEAVILYEAMDGEEFEALGEIRLPRDILQAMHRLTK